MNLIHRWVCGSRRWKALVETQMAPWALERVNLCGGRVLEIGPGPGAATEYLLARVEHLTCLEINADLASALTRRLGRRNLTVHCGDATSMPFPDATFDAVVSFSMLHHVPSAQLQNQVLHECRRVLRPGGVVAGADVLPGALFKVMHVFTDVVPVDPRGLPGRFLAARLTALGVDVGRYAFRFRARRAGL
jgi:SAM-dependent methyltransferase